MNVTLHNYHSPRTFGRAGQQETMIFIPGSSIPVPGIIREVPPDGAVLRTSLKNLPEQFEVFLPSANRRIAASVVGHTDDGPLLRFVDRLDGAAAAQRSGEGSKPAAKPQALALARAPEPAAPSEMVPTYAFDYVADPVFSTRGICKIAVSVRNQGGIVAHQPFLCLPLLGLAMEAADGWAYEDVVSVRKVRRFARPGVYDVNPGSDVHCCNIMLNMSVEGGGIVEYEAGTRHRFDNLPDLRLTTIIGAGNYPSNRVAFVVPATDIVAFFKECIARGEIPPLVR